MTVPVKPTPCFSFIPNPCVPIHYFCIPRLDFLLCAFILYLLTELNALPTLWGLGYAFTMSLCFWLSSMFHCLAMPRWYCLACASNFPCFALLFLSISCSSEEWAENVRIWKASSGLPASLQTLYTCLQMYSDTAVAIFWLKVFCIGTPLAL